MGKVRSKYCGFPCLLCVGLAACILDCFERYTGQQGITCELETDQICLAIRIDNLRIASLCLERIQPSHRDAYRL
jgi:hypothetical protein